MTPTTIVTGGSSAPTSTFKPLSWRQVEEAGNHDDYERTILQALQEGSVDALIAAVAWREYRYQTLILTVERSLQASNEAWERSYGDDWQTHKRHFERTVLPQQEQALEAYRVRCAIAMGMAFRRGVRWMAAIDAHYAAVVERNLAEGKPYSVAWMWGYGGAKAFTTSMWELWQKQPQARKGAA